MPSCVTFLDVDDLAEISRLEAYIKSTDLVLVVVTDKYLSSRNCRRELVAAHTLGKHLFRRGESEASKGARTAEQLKGELSRLGHRG